MKQSPNSSSISKSQKLARAREVRDMMNKMSGEELERKLKREKVQVCLNCRLFSKCDNVGEYEECGDFVEVEDEAWVIRKI